MANGIQPEDIPMPEHFDVEIVKSGEPIVRKTMAMSPELSEALRSFRWRMARARELVEDPEQMDNMGLDSKHAGLFRAALVSYLRENED